MRQGIRDFVEIVSQTLHIPDPVVEFGACQSQPGFSDLRPFFPGKKYIGCDMRKGPGVDRIANVHDSDFAAESIGTVLLLETLEHVQFPIRAMEEVHRILKPNGAVMLSSQMNYPIHDVHDYWRFTPEAFLTLLKDFPFAFADSAGDPLFPPAVIGVGVKGNLPEATVKELRAKIRKWGESWNQASAAEGFPVVRAKWKEAVELFTPPIVLKLYRSSKRALRAS
jgi:hypothetical protein